MKTKAQWMLIPVLAGLGLFASGCASARMKGTPFYTGEYAKRTGPDEQRINGWPLLYYRDPALSVLWPIFERTDDHAAVRPLFSVYGLDESNREYNVLWPLAQFDHRRGRHHVFPLFWGKDHRVLFPVYWHYDEPFGPRGGSDSVFPLYWYTRDQNGSLFLSLPWMSGHHGDARWRLLMPLFYWRTNNTGSVLVTPLWSQGRSPTSDWWAVVPLAYWDREQRTWLSPLWAQWQARDHETWLAPWSLSWATRRPDRTDLWLMSGLAHGSWGEKDGSHHVLPFYFRKAEGDTLLTPIFGWSDAEDFFYPLTPLAGVRKGEHRGSWLFPVYSHSVNERTSESTDRLLLLAGHSKKVARTNTWLLPLFSHHDRGSVESAPAPGKKYGHFGQDFWCLPFCWWNNESTVQASGPGTNVVRTYRAGHGAFPLWSYSTRTMPTDGTSTVRGSMLVRLYDYKHEVGNTAKGAMGTSDYTRARVLWRLWHYERLDGDVSVDVFPGFTYDRKQDGFEKTSFLWRMFRHERNAEGAQKLDVLFVPLKR